MKVSKQGKASPRMPERRPEGEKHSESKVSSDLCRHFLKGSCIRDNCRFSHDCPPGGGDTPPAPAVRQRKAKRKLVTLDCRVSDDTLLQLREDYPSLDIQNGPEDSLSPHPTERARRACDTNIVLQYGRRISARGSILDIQGKLRSTDSVSRDACRKYVTPEDLGHALCSARCAHDVALEQGKYSVVMAIDTPLSPAALKYYTSMCSCVITATHVYSVATGTVDGQTVSWEPEPGDMDPARRLAETGSVGRFKLVQNGRATTYEADHFWLTAGIAIDGVVPEAFMEPIGSTVFTRYKRQPAMPLVPSIVSSYALTAGLSRPPGYYAVSRLGGNDLIFRAGPQLIILQDQHGLFATTSAVLTQLSGYSAGRPMGGAPNLARLAARLASEDPTGNVHRVVAYVTDAEVQLQLNIQEGLDAASKSSVFARIPFGWLIPGTSVRDQAAILARRARGEYVTPLRMWCLRATILLALLAFVPWPWYEVHCWTSWSFDRTEYPMYLGFFLAALAAPLFYVSVPAWTLLAITPTFALPWFDLPFYWPSTRTVCQRTWSSHLLDGFDVVPRAIILILVVLMLSRQAYAAPEELRASYELDRFEPVQHEGPLPDGFGLPGYVADVPLKPLGRGCKIKVRPPSTHVDTTHPKDCLFAVGVVFAGHLPHVTLPCQHNMIVACRNRQLADMPQPVESVFIPLANEYLEQFEAPEDVPAPHFDTWNDRFPPGRAAEHRAALARLLEQIVDLKDIVCRKAFVKIEKVLRVLKRAFDPRLITGATNEFNVIWGNYFFVARDVLKAAYDALAGNVLLASGSTSRELGVWFETAWNENGRAICGDDQIIITDGIFVESDGARHDAHMNRMFFEFKWALYGFLFHDIPDEIVLLAKEEARETRGKNAPYGVAYSHPYRVRSGDPDTEKGNSVCTDFVAWYTQRLVHDNKGEIVDDIRDLVRESVLKLGYEVELKVTRDPTAVTFLSGGFLPVDGDMYWYPLPGRQLVKIGWSLREPTKKVMWSDFAGVLNSFRDYTFVPFIGAYVDVVSQLVPERYRLEPPSKRWHVGPGKTPQAPAADTWDWFSRRYGLDEGDEQEFRRRLQGVTKMPYMLNDPAIITMVEIDMA